MGCSTALEAARGKRDVLDPEAKLVTGVSVHILDHMKTILIEIDDRTARELEVVAPTKKRMRADFVRLAIRSALDRALDRATEQAYREQPLASGFAAGDLVGWDDENALKAPASSGKKTRGRKSRKIAA